MAQYTVKSDMHLGEQVNDIGVRKAVKVTKGQIVEGDVITRFVFNKNTQGIEYKIPTTIGGQGRPSDGMDKFFIPLYNLETSTSSSPQTVSNNTKSTTPSKSFFTPKNIIIGLVGIGVVLGILKWQKII
jgi:hypothetical protein